MIGKTNAVIGGGTTKTDYEEWQEGFGYNWDSVVANAPMTNTERILHIYTKVEILKMASNFPTSAEIYTYNGSAYRQIIMDADYRLAFIEADYITNTFDNLQYVCVIYGNSEWRQVFQTWLPVVYGNSKAVTLGDADWRANLLRTVHSSHHYPLLRGVDVNLLSSSTLFSGLEHLTYQTVNPGLYFAFVGVGNSEIRLFKELCDTLPSGRTYGTQVAFSAINATITDEVLADWFYNTWLYTNITTETRYNYPPSNYVRKFKVNSAISLTAVNASYPYARILNCDYIDGTFTEDQAGAYPGLHGFNTKHMRNLKNFPMWTVLDGANTGCLRPAASASSAANFIFYSNQLEGKYFAKFDGNGNIDLDPTKTFVANLPFLSGNVAQTITFDDTTFKNQFTAEERTQIEDLVVNQKKWGLSW